MLGVGEDEDEEGREEADLMTNSTPPARGTRTYCACPPGRASDPKSSWCAHRDVKPKRQKLKEDLNGGANRDRTVHALALPVARAEWAHHEVAYFQRRVQRRAALRVGRRIGERVVRAERDDFADEFMPGDDTGERISTMNGEGGRVGRASRESSRVLCTRVSRSHTVPPTSRPQRHRKRE